MSAVLEGPGLLFRGVPPFRETPGSPGSTKAVPAEPEREEGAPSGREPPSSRVEQKE